LRQRSDGALELFHFSTVHVLHRLTIPTCEAASQHFHGGPRPNWLVEEQLFQGLFVEQKELGLRPLLEKGGRV
jgi:hypothetical protein